MYQCDNLWVHIDFLTKTDSVSQTLDMSAFCGGQYTDKQTARRRTDEPKNRVENNIIILS